MTLWTIQSITAWKILQREQVLFADQRYSEDLFLDAYRWMTKKMEHRIESESENTSLPLWAWYQWNGKRRKPDLRSSAHLPKGQRGVRIELPVRAYHQRIEDSWDRIFDLDWAEEEISDPFSKKSIQATFWKLHFDQIRNIQFFTAR